MEYSNDFNVTSCCCCGQGNFSVHCILDKNAYAPGEIAVVTAEINARKMKTKIRSNSNDTKTIEYKVAEVDSDSVETGQEKNLINKLLLVSNEQNIEPTTNGMIVQCNYSIHYTADVSFCLCGPPPGFRIPIQIYQQPPYLEPIIPPQNWNPQVMPANNLIFNKAYQFDQPAINFNVMQQQAMPQNNQVVNRNFQYPQQPLNDSSSNFQQQQGFGIYQ